ncbi:MAG: uracil-DNA glycosylase [Burkholderiales bacterium]
MLLEMGVRVWLPTSEVDAADPEQAAQPTETRAAPSASARALPAPAAGPTNPPNPRVATAPTGAPIAPAKAAKPDAVTVAPTNAASTSERAAAIAAMDWPELEQAVSGCRACALCNGRKNTVFGVGQEAPVDWLIVGEAPGENEDIQGEPFVGAAGKLLDNMLKAVALDRHGGQPQKVFIANVLKCRPPGNRNPQAAEIAQCTPYLARQIELLQPKVILALGRFAVQTLLAPSVADVEKQPLGKLRGKVYRWKSDTLDVPVVVSYHPAYLLRSLPDKAKAWADLCLALQVLRDLPARRDDL